VSTGLYDDVTDQSRHAQTISRLAAAENLPLEDGRRIYEIALAELKVGARVKDFLPILTTRRTQELIWRTRRLHARA
jgi:hypothetical protein